MKNQIRLQRPVKNGTEEIELGVNQFHNGKLIFNVAGSLENLDGQNERYKQMAKFMQEKQLGTVVRIGNELGIQPWPITPMDNIRFSLDYCLKNAEELTGKKDPRIYMMGYSAGGGIVANIAPEFSDIEKILLIAPGIDCGKKRTEGALGKFQGEVYDLIGKWDSRVGKAGDAFYKWATKAKKKELIKLPQVTHDFSGEVNSKILSKAPLWAFAGDESFPSPEGGIAMYDKGKQPFQMTAYVYSEALKCLVEVPLSKKDFKRYYSDNEVTRISSERKN